MFRKSLLSFVVCCVLLGAVSQFVWKWHETTNKRLIAWDISGYYMYLPFLFYDDLGKHHNRQYIIDTYHPSENGMEAFLNPETGNYIIKYSSGMAVMYLPGFAAGHLYAKAAGYPVDGYSYPYQFCMAMYSLLVAFIGLWLIRKVLLNYFTDTAVAIVLLILCFATNYLSYAGVVNMFSHPYLFTIYAAIIWLTIKWYTKKSYLLAASIGLLCGLAALTRPTEVICIIVPAMWGIGGIAQAKERVALLIKEYKMVLLLAACAIAVGSLQLLYWKHYTGHWIYWSYASDEGFFFLKPYIMECLISYKKGWLIYTPVMILSLLGFIPLYKNNRNIFWPILLLTLISLYITFSWSCWWYGGSFSMRAVIQYYAILVFPLAAFVSWALQRWVGIISLSVFVTFCVWLNFVMTYQASVSFIGEYDNMSRAYFWKIFGKWDTDKSDRKFLDTQDDMPARYVAQLKAIYTADTTMLGVDTVINGEKVWLCNGRNVITGAAIDIGNRPPGWYRLKASIYATSIPYVEQQAQPSIYVSLNNNGSEERRMFYFIQRIIEQQKWEEISIDIKKITDNPANELRFGIYHNQPNVWYLKNLEVQYIATQ